MAETLLLYKNEYYVLIIIQLTLGVKKVMHVGLNTKQTVDKTKQVLKDCP